MRVILKGNAMRVILTLVCGIALVATAQTSLASIVVASGDPIEGHSWATVFHLSAGDVDRIELSMVSTNETFKVPGIEFTTDGGGQTVLELGWTREFNDPLLPTEVAVFAPDTSSVNNPFFRVWFPDASMSLAPSFTFKFDAYLDGVVVEKDKLTWPGQGFDSAFDWVIEPLGGGPPMPGAPEPASMLVWTVFGACGIGFGWRRWRKRAA